MSTYCFDLDGTICRTPAMDYGAAVPRLDVIARINALARAGHRIVVDTARGSVTATDWSGLTAEQLQLWGVVYHELRCGQKIVADYYVDDKAVNVDAWMAER